MNNDLDQLCANTLRILSAEAVQHVGSGHPGMAMGAADMAYVLWTRYLKHNPANPDWFDRDRFILSAGHGSILLYSLLYLTGYDLTLEDLKNFRRWGSRTPGHPERGLTPGVEVTTGPLGQGFANGVGMALAERFMAERFNRPEFPLVNHYTYVMVSDGDIMEGISQEAASLAGHLGLGKLIYLYDANEVSIDGSTRLSFTEDVSLHFRGYGWHTVEVDGHDHTQVGDAIALARTETERPSLIVAHTHIAYGSPHKQDSAQAHGAPLGEEEVRLTKEALGWTFEEPFYVPEEVMAHFRQAGERGGKREADWSDLFNRYAAAQPELAAAWKQALAGRPPEGWEDSLPNFKPEDGPIPNRVASGKVLNAIASSVPTLVGGSADLHPANNTYLEEYEPIRPGDFSGRNLHFGVREHAMGGILNGIVLHGGLIPYGGTFLAFTDYFRPSIRLAALMELPVIYLLTHDSLGVGEDGPTHQPVEHLPALRAIPNLTVLRPADSNEVTEAWRWTLNQRTGPVALIIGRHPTPVLDRSKLAPASGLARGAYVIADAPEPDLLLIATGTEVHLAVQAQALLAEEGIAARVVSMPSWELFEAQSQDYRDSVLPPAIKARVAVEAARGFEWRRYIGPYGRMLGVDRFGASAHFSVVLEKYGFTPENVAAEAKACLKALEGEAAG